jgi:hypothetical protein
MHAALENARQVNRDLGFFGVSALNEWDLQDWFGFLRHSVAREHAIA